MPLTHVTPRGWEKGDSKGQSRHGRFCRGTRPAVSVPSNLQGFRGGELYPPAGDRTRVGQGVDSSLICAAPPWGNEWTCTVPDSRLPGHRPITATAQDGRDRARPSHHGIPPPTEGHAPSWPPIAEAQHGCDGVRSLLGRKNLFQIESGITPATSHAPSSPWHSACKSA